MGEYYQTCRHPDEQVVKTGSRTEGKKVVYTFRCKLCGTTWDVTPAVFDE